MLKGINIGSFNIEIIRSTFTQTQCALSTMTNTDGDVTHLRGAGCKKNRTACSHPGHRFGSGGSYSYDVNGNRTMGGYVTGADNRLAKDGTFSYSYDNEGNRTARFPAPVVLNNVTQTYDPQSWSADSSKNTATTYRYDHHNHLIGVISRSIDFNGNVTTTSDTINRYDALDRRSESGQRNSDSGDYGLTRYGYDDQQLLLIDHPNSPAASTDYSNFMLAPDGTIVGRYHTWPGDVHAWFLNDDQDTVHDSYSNGGAYHHDFDAFGGGDQVDSFGIGYAKLRSGDGKLPAAGPGE